MVQKRYIIVLLLVAITLPMSLVAQQNKWEVGIQTGASQIHYVADNDRLSIQLESEKEIVATAGATLRYNWSDIITIRSGLMYERKGGFYSMKERTPQQPSGTGNRIEFETYFEYITVPALIEINVWRKIPVYLVAGPYFGIPVNVTERIDGRRLSSTIDPRFPQVGIMGGIGGELKISSRLLLTMEISRDLSITAPMTNISEEADFNLSGTNLVAGISYNI